MGAARAFSTVVAALILTCPPASASAGAVGNCKAAKASAAGKKAAALLQAIGRNLKSPNASKLSFEVSKAQSKFTKAFTSAEARGGCSTVDDAAAVEAKVDALVANVVADVAPPPPPGCGNEVLDPGEACDGSAPGGDGACPNRCLPEAQVGGDPECVCNVDPTPVAVGGSHRGATRPMEGGGSVFSSEAASCLLTAGFVSAGTLGAVVFPTTGPVEPYLLSNNHVLGRQSDHDATTPDDARCAGSPETTAGDAVMQPGALDGGAIGADDVGVLPSLVLAGAAPALDPYEPICFPSGYCPGAPGFPLPLCNGAACVDAPTENCVDAAIAKITVPAAAPAPGAAAVLDIGPNATFGAPAGPASCKDSAIDPSVIGRVVKKSGRTTGFTWGRITGIVDVVVAYGAGLCSVASGNAGQDCLVDADCPSPVSGACVLVEAGYGSTLASAPLFVNQLLITGIAGSVDFSLPGDSGSVIFTGADEPIGLLFAGGGSYTFANPIKPVLSRFGIGF
jgi:hypothetical protein